MILTVVNPHVDTPVEADIRIYGDARLQGAQARVLAHEDIHAHNTFEQPDAVTPQSEEALSAKGTSFAYRFAPASVSRLDLELG